MDNEDRGERWTAQRWAYGGTGGGIAGTPEDEYRVSDAEREAALTELRRHTVSGRLSTTEFSQRTDEALAARTAGELRSALRGLPRPEIDGRQRAQRAPLRLHLHPMVVLFIVLAVIGLSSGHGWVLVPLLWLWFGVFRPRRWSHRGYSPDSR